MRARECVAFITYASLKWAFRLEFRRPDLSSACQFQLAPRERLRRRSNNGLSQKKKKHIALWVGKPELLLFGSVSSVGKVEQVSIAIFQIRQKNETL